MIPGESFYDAGFVSSDANDQIGIHIDRCHAALGDEALFEKRPVNDFADTLLDLDEALYTRDWREAHRLQAELLHMDFYEYRQQRVAEVVMAYTAAPDASFFERGRAFGEMLLSGLTYGDRETLDWQYASSLDYCIYVTEAIKRDIGNRRTVRLANKLLFHASRWGLDLSSEEQSVNDIL